jgi:hypothetical protein
MRLEDLHGLDEVNVVIAVGLSEVRSLIRPNSATGVMMYLSYWSLPGSAAKVS